jgi:hypothetical protein
MTTNGWYGLLLVLAVSVMAEVFLSVIVVGRKLTRRGVNPLAVLLPWRHAHYVHLYRQVCQEECRSLWAYHTLIVLAMFNIALGILLAVTWISRLLQPAYP